MSAELNSWQILSPYLDQVLTLSEEERARWLESLRAKDPSLAGQLENLLSEHRAAQQEKFLEKPVSPPLNPGLTGQTVGAYRLLLPIGQGGMSTVWLAERSDGRFQRKAAVKFLLVARLGQDAEARFRREGTILGSLSHPHIAELLDAGVSSTGQPYLVLEYVEGQPIDRYCAEHKLDIRERVHLFLDVLSAVAHAHANLTVHRDIKPSNVLVNEEGQVKLLDFGIAKLLEGEGPDGVPTLLTEGAGSPLTPEFAAPEQVTGAPITTATDVYGLGVLLYVLLTGQHPAGPGPHSPAELVKAITETDPPRPSKAVASTTGQDPSSTANRAISADKLSRQLRGDLDTIVAKALKKNPQDRYGSVAAFAEDLSRYLRNEPISARPDTLVYRATKFARRNQTAVALAALTFIAATVGVITTRQQRNHAYRERDRANRVTVFMTDMFKVSNPSQARGNSITAREILDKAALQIDSGLTMDPETQAHMMYVMGDVYNGLGLIQQGEALVARAVAIQRKLLGPDDPETLTSESLLSVLLLDEGRYAEAEKLQRETLEIRRRVLGPEHPDTVRSMSRLAGVLSWQGRGAEAEALERGAIAIESRVFGPEHEETLRSRNSLVGILWLQADKTRYAEVETLARATLPAMRRVLGPEHPQTLIGIKNLAAILRLEGQFQESEVMLRETLPIWSRVFGPEHPDTLDLRNDLAVDVAKQGRYSEAEQLYRDTRAIQQRVGGPEDASGAVSTYNLACLAAVQGQSHRALSLLAEALTHGLDPPTELAMENDDDLKSLRGIPRFAALVGQAKKQAAEAQKTN